MKKIIIFVLLAFASMLFTSCSAIEPAIDREIKELIKDIPYPAGYNYVYDTGEKIQFGDDIDIDYMNKSDLASCFGTNAGEPVRFFDETTGEEITQYRILLYTKNDGIFILVYNRPQSWIDANPKEYSLYGAIKKSFTIRQAHELQDELYWKRYEK